MKCYLALLLILILTTGCVPSPTITPVTIDGAKTFLNDTLPLKVSELESLSLTSVDTFHKYKQLADKTNSLIRILNEQTDMFDIPLLEPTQEGWNKASRYITEYGPLINNYNNVITEANNYKVIQNEQNLKNFYLSAGVFAFETALIVWAVYYKAAYTSVGIAYRSTNLNRLALKCGSCVSVILSEAHWFVRTVLVEGTSQAFQFAIRTTEDFYDSIGGVEGIKNETVSLIDTGKDVIKSVT